MPTFNQLVRKGREVLTTKSTAPALQKTYNSQKKQYSDLSSPSAPLPPCRRPTTLRRSSILI